MSAGEATSAQRAPAVRANRLVGTVMTLLASTSVLAVLGTAGASGLLLPVWAAVPLLAVFGGAFAVAVARSVLGRPPEPAAASLLVAGLACLVAALVLGTLGLVPSTLSPLGVGWPWHVAVAAMAGCAVLVRRLSLRRGAVLLVLLAVVCAALRSVPPTGAPGASPTDATGRQDALFLVSLGVAVFAATRGVEDVNARLRVAREVAAAADAEVEQLALAEADRGRWEAAVHDDVLSALRAAEVAQGAGERRAAAEAAREALDRLATRPSSLVVGCPAVVSRLEAAVADGAPGVAVHVTAGRGSLPGRVAEALVEATAELVRNARRHAGEGARVRVSGAVGATGAVVVVDDDGAGFDPARVGAARLGLRVSVQGRMRTVGGTAVVTSAPAQGVSAVLRWPA